MDFAKNVLIEGYSEKYLSGRPCGDEADSRVDIGRTVPTVRSHVDMTV